MVDRERAGSTSEQASASVGSRMSMGLCSAVVAAILVSTSRASVKFLLFFFAKSWPIYIDNRRFSAREKEQVLFEHYFTYRSEAVELILLFVNIEYSPLFVFVHDCLLLSFPILALQHNCLGLFVHICLGWGHKLATRRPAAPNVLEKPSAPN